VTVYAPGTQERDQTKQNMALQQHAQQIATNTSAIATNTSAISALQGSELTAASKSDQEMATSTVKAVVPAVQQSHPSAAKAWVVFDGTGAVGAITPGASCNVSGVTKNGTGDYTISFTVPFSSANYAAACFAENSEGATLNAPAPLNSHTRAAGSHRVLSSSSGGVALDFNFVSLIWYGDQ